MMIWLSFLVCFNGGVDCHVDVPLIEPVESLTMCQMQGMQIAPQWEDGHKGWKVAKIRCSFGTKPKQENEI